MLYRIFHPHDSHVCFLYDDTLPQAMRRIQGQTAELVPLRYKTTNFEDFIFCMLKAKVVHLDDKQVGFAYLDDRKIAIARPYDCRWAANHVFGIQEKDALFMMDRQERRYVLTLNDADMRISQEEWARLQREGFASEDMNRGFAGNHFTRQFDQAQKAFSAQSQAWQTAFEEDLSETEQAFQTRADSTAGFETSESHLPPSFAEQQQDVFEKQAAFQTKMEHLTQKAGALSKAMDTFPEEALREKFAQKQKAQTSDQEESS